MSQAVRRFRPKGPQPLADLVTPVIGPALARQGFSETGVLMRWAEIVGEPLADRCQPVKLQWRPRTSDTSAAIEPATLVVRVEGAFAVQLQHMASIVIERVNVFFGWRCVGKLVLKQGPLRAVSRMKGIRPQPDHASRARAADAASTVEDEALRLALVALGTRVLAR